jgi:hypothetical protein
VSEEKKLATRCGIGNGKRDRTIHSFDKGNNWEKPLGPALGAALTGVELGSELGDALGSTLGSALPVGETLG